MGQQHPLNPRPGRCFIPYRQPEKIVTLRLKPGPQADEDALVGLTERPFTVASADRVGVRLGGVPVAGGDVLSEATPLGAV